MKRVVTVGMGIAILFAVFGIARHTGAQSSAGECPIDSFVDVAGTSAGTNYAAPSLSVSCDEDSLIIQSNGIPNYEFVQITPNDLRTQNYNWSVPLNPQMSDTTTEIPLLGVVAVAVNGMPVFGPNEAQDLGFGDPKLDNLLDFCNGHTAPGGMYHYHARPDCLYEDGTPGVVLAYSLDGYPILSPYACTDAACTTTEKLTSSWQRTKDVTAAWEAHEYVEGSGDLDQCNGRIDENGDYAYYATDTFPYMVGCYRGVVSEEMLNQMGMGGQPGSGQRGGQPGQPPQGGQQPPQGGDGRMPPPPPPGGGNPPPPGGRP